MSSRKEQREALRQERLEGERQAQESQRRRRMVGFGVGGVLALAAVVAVAVVLLAGGGGEASVSVLPGGGEVPEQQITDLQEAASAAGCELKSRRVKRSELNPDAGDFHFPDINKAPTDPWNPPAAGGHYPEPADDGAYSEAPPTSQLVHAAEHGRVTVWFKPSLPSSARANTKAFFDDDSYQMILTPNTTKMPYDVAATAWNRDPTPNGTGRLLGCPKYSDKVFDALAAFREQHRSNGPEPVP